MDLLAPIQYLRKVPFRFVQTIRLAYASKMILKPSKKETRLVYVSIQYLIILTSKEWLSSGAAEHLILKLFARIKSRRYLWILTKLHIQNVAYEFKILKFKNIMLYSSSHTHIAHPILI